MSVDERSHRVLVGPLGHLDALRGGVLEELLETGATVNLPLDAAVYETHLKSWIASSRFNKNVAADAQPADDLATSFNTNPN